ncbi:MAG TPA: DUF4390 domain-containing protein [Thermodesulfovibrionales bacterium]|nr:DUF4390 domain-containing protein [Thermodesulfovibrionales bacterium]
MKKICAALSIYLFFSIPLAAFGAEIVGPETQTLNDSLQVTTGLTLDEKNLTDLKNGVGKEITFYLDIYRVWRVWPDEFIAGKKIVTTLKGDPIKKEYVATSSDGSTLTKKRFRDLESMLAWALTLKDIPLIHMKELDPATYFVRVAVEARLRTLPPVIGYLLFFVPEKEFKVTKDSAFFSVGAAP